MAARRFPGSKWRLKVSANSSTSPRCSPSPRPSPAGGRGRSVLRNGRWLHSGSGRSAKPSMRRHMGRRCSAFTRPGTREAQRRIAGQLGDQAFAQADPVPGGAGGQRLDLHAGHVHARRAFAAAGLAGDAQLQGGRHVVAAHRVGAELARQRQAEGVGASPGQVGLVAGGRGSWGTWTRRRSCGTSRCCCTSRRRTACRPAGPDRRSNPTPGRSPGPTA